MTNRQKSTPYMVALVWVSMIMSAVALGGVIVNGLSASPAYWLMLIGIVAASIVFTDAGTGLFHHLCDVIKEHHVWPKGLLVLGDNFQRHHIDPRDLAKHPFAFHTADSQMVVIPALTGMALLTWTWPSCDALVVFFVTTANCILLAQEFHRAAHQLPEERWKIVIILQKLGLALQPSEHARHHAGGHVSHFAILTGWSNSLLDTWEFRLTPRGPKTTLQQKLLAWVSRMQAPIDSEYWVALQEWQCGLGPDEINH